MNVCLANVSQSVLELWINIYANLGMQGNEGLTSNHFEW